MICFMYLLIQLLIWKPKLFLIPKTTIKLQTNQRFFLVPGLFLFGLGLDWIGVTLQALAISAFRSPRSKSSPFGVKNRRIFGLEMGTKVLPKTHPYHPHMISLEVNHALKDGGPFWMMMIHLQTKKW